MSSQRRPFLPFVLLAVFAAAVTLVIGCKQGEGERCQVTSDCDDGLICNQGTSPPSCQKTVGGGIDATVPDMDPDAAIDAPIDAPPDAPVDAPPRT